MADGKPGNGATPPFGDGNGATSSAGPYSGAHDFTKDPKSHAPATGGRDFTKENRPQSMAEGRPAGQPNTTSIPAGGKDLKADPGPVSKNIAGAAQGLGRSKPFRLKG